MIRRNPVRQLLLLLSALTIFGCSVYDPSLVESGSGGSSGTGGGGTGGGGTGGGGTGGDCVPTNGGVEICDTLDNDCNNEINDGPAADSCRMMGRVNATSRCTASGACLLQTCDVGFYNCDGRPENGCESVDADVECGACGKVCEDDAGVLADAGDASLDDASLGDGSVDVDASMGCVPSGLEVCDGVDNDCDDTVDNGNTCPAGCTGRSGVGGAYALCTAPQNWSAARAACAAAPLLMRLVRINDATENAFVNTFVTDVLGGTGTAWIGANDATTEGEWRWLQGTMIAGPQFWMGTSGGSVVGGLYTNWGAGQPDEAGGGEDCGQMFANGTWNDAACGSSTMAYVCEK